MKLLFTAAAAALLATSVGAQQTGQYPIDVVKAIVGYPAGQTTDIVTRIISERLSQKWKTPVVVQNIAGAGSTIAAATAARAKQDGQTILFTANAAMVTGPHIYKNLTYKPFEDFEFVNLSIWVPYVCAVNPALPVTDMASLRKYIKDNPGKVAYGSPGIATMSHLTMERLKAEHGFDVLHVPYQGSAAVLTDLASGNLQFACEPTSVVGPFIDGGRIRPIAVTSEKRLPGFPKVPTIGETYHGFTSGAWIGVVVPKGVPKATFDKLNADIDQVLQEKSVKERFEKMGLAVISAGPEKFTQLAKEDDKTYGQLIRSLNLQ
ncbi:Bug family tripartite tricarboxylate transporter substrate binding protein [Polaromonas sp.]|uniref:Bug family tripartite tricarboxylate transporter substrate binding protein n=1 Tax=Polaromonas sp. TaxID=1869339 RepID=UPI0035692F1E